MGALNGHFFFPFWNIDPPVAQEISLSVLFFFHAALLKLLPAIYFFHQMVALQKLLKSLLFCLKRSFCSWDIQIFVIFSFPHFPDSKGQMNMEWFIMSWTGLHKLSNLIFRITQKPLYIRNKRTLLNFFCNLKVTGH